MSKEIISQRRWKSASGSVIGRNAAWAVVQVIVSTAVLFVVYYFVVRVVGVDQIGLLSIVSTTAAFARLSELGLSGAVTRFLPDHLARDEATDAAQVIVTATTALSLSVGLVSVLAWPALNALLPFVLDSRHVPEARLIIPATLLSLWTNIVSSCVVMSLDGVNRADRRAQITLLSQGVFAIAAVLMIRRLGIVAIPIAQVMQGACVFLLAVFLMLLELPELKAARPSFACFRRIWLFGAHLQLISLLILFYDPTTRLLLNYFGSLGVVGYFDLANRLVSQVRSLIVSANQVLVPHYANLNITNPEMVARTVKANFQILLVVSTIVFSMLSVASFFIGDLWIGKGDAAFVEACMILVVGYFFNTLSVGIYFMNIGTGAVLNNVLMWTVIILVNVIGGAFGGLMFGVTGVLASVAGALICGSLVAFADYLRRSNLPVRMLASKTVLRFSVVGAAVFVIAFLSAAIGFPIGNGIAASLAPVALGGFIWTCFILREASIAGQSPFLWARTTIASIRS